MNILRQNKKLTEDQYIERLRKGQKRLTTIFVIFAIIYLITPHIFPKNDFLQGYTASLFVVSAIISIFFHIRINRIMEDPERLKRMKVKLEDERSILIKEKAATTSYWISMMLLILIGAVFAFFNYKITIIAVATAFAMNLIFFIERMSLRENIK